MRRSPRRKARFARKIKFLLDDILKRKFSIVSCDIVTDIENFDFGDIKFTKGKKLLCVEKTEIDNWVNFFTLGRGKKGSIFISTVKRLHSMYRKKCPSKCANRFLKV